MNQKLSLGKVTFFNHDQAKMILKLFTLGITKMKKECAKDISNVDVCKDELNNPQCGYSNGQCCGKATLHFCSDCECKDPRNTKTRGEVDLIRID